MMARGREFPTDPALLPHSSWDPFAEDDSYHDDELLDWFDELLDERERFILDALLFEKLSLREVGRRLSLSKTQVARTRDNALSKMRAEIILQRGI